MNKIGDVQVAESELLQKSYNAKDLLGQTFVVNDFSVLKGDNGDYIKADITGDNLEAGKPFSTGAHNICVKLHNAKEQGLLPVEVTVIKLGGNAFDIA